MYLTPPLKGFPLELGIGARGQKSSNDGATRWSKKFSDRFSHLDTIPAVTDGRTRCRSKDDAYYVVQVTRSSADADNGLDAFSSQSRSTNMVPFLVHCDFSSSRRAVFTIFNFKKCCDLEIGVKGH